MIDGGHNAAAIHAWFTHGGLYHNNTDVHGVACRSPRSRLSLSHSLFISRSYVCIFLKFVGVYFMKRKTTVWSDLTSRLRVRSSQGKFYTKLNNQRQAATAIYSHTCILSLTIITEPQKTDNMYAGSDIVNSDFMSHLNFHSIS